MQFLIGTLYGGLMESPTLYFQPPYMIVEAKTRARAIEKYNGKTKASYFYGDVIARIEDNMLVNISKYITVEEAESIYNKIK